MSDTDTTGSDDPTANRVIRAPEGDNSGAGDVRPSGSTVTGVRELSGRTRSQPPRGDPGQPVDTVGRGIPDRPGPAWAFPAPGVGLHSKTTVS